jgi:hypothetical protein
MTNANTLIYHPRPFDDEGLQGFMLRISEGNYLPNSRYLWEGNQSSLETLAGYLGLNDSDPLKTLQQQLNNQGTLPVWNRKYGRACPECLRQQSYWKQYWELSMASCCPHHGLVLQETCHRCGTPINWQRNSLLHCSCGRSYSGLVEENASAEEIRFNRILYDSLTRKTSFKRDINQLNLSQLHRLIVTLGVYASGSGGIAEIRKKTISRLEHVRPVMLAAASVLVDWPRGFFAMLDRIQEVHAATGSQKLTQRFGRFYNYLYKNFKDPEYGFVLNGFEKYLERSWHHALVGRNKRLSTYTRNRHIWVSVKTVANDLGCGVKALHRLIDDGLIESSQVTTAKGRKMVCISRRQLSKISELLNDRIDLKTASKLLNIPDDRVRQLANHEVMGKAVFAENSRDRRWQISRSTINNLLMLGSELPIIQDINSEIDIKLLDAFRYLLDRDYLFPRLIIEMVTAAFEPKGYLQGEAGLAAWVYDKKLLQQWISDLLKGERNGALSISQLALELNIKEEVAYILVALEIIGSTRDVDTGQRLVELEAIDEFRQKYIFARDLAALYGTTSKAVIAMLARQNIEPANKNFEIACRQFLFERSRIPREVLAIHLND